MTPSSPGGVDGLRDRLQADLREAMRAHDQVRVSVLRTALAALADAEAPDARAVEVRSGLYAAEVDRLVLGPDDVHGVLDEVRDELLGAADEMAGLGQTGEAERLRRQAGIIEGYAG